MIYFLSLYFNGVKKTHQLQNLCMKIIIIHSLLGSKNAHSNHVHLTLLWDIGYKSHPAQYV